MGLLKPERSGSEQALAPEWLNNGGVGIAQRSSYVNRSRSREREERDSRFYPNFGRGRYSERERDRDAWNRDWRSHDRLVEDVRDRDRGSGYHRSPPSQAIRLDGEIEWHGYQKTDRFRTSPSQQNQGSNNRFMPPDFFDSSMAPKTPEAICSKMPEVVSSRMPDSPSFPSPRISEPFVHAASSPVQVRHGGMSFSSPDVCLSQAAIDTPQMRLDEIALRQSRQLIPMKPSLPKTMAPSRKTMKATDLKSGQPLSPVTPYRAPVILSSVTKPTPGRLHVLGKESSAAPLANRTTAAPPVLPPTGGKVDVHEERKPLAHSQNRTNFYNTIRKKAATNGENRNPDSPNGEEQKKVPVMEVIVTESADAVNEGKPKEAKPAAPTKNGLWCEAEETAFLISLGWNDKPDSGPLTDEEIHSFVREHMSALASAPSVINGKNRALCSVLLDLGGGSLASPSSSSSSESDCGFKFK